MIVGQDDVEGGLYDNVDDADEGMTRHTRTKIGMKQMSMKMKKLLHTTKTTKKQRLRRSSRRR